MSAIDLIDQSKGWLTLLIGPNWTLLSLAKDILTIVSLGFGLWLVSINWKRFQNDIRKDKEAEYRKTEVLNWANECIRRLQHLYLLSSLSENFLSKKEIKDCRIKLMFDISALIEQGRLLFRNEKKGTFGHEKPKAYQGLRPRILDHLVLAHIIARDWPSMDEDAILRRTVLLEECEKEFVSLAQQEVGRDECASAHAASGGSGVYLAERMSLVDIRRIDKKRCELVEINRNITDSY